MMRPASTESYPELCVSHREIIRGYLCCDRPCKRRPPAYCKQRYIPRSTHCRSCLCTRSKIKVFRSGLQTSMRPRSSVYIFDCTDTANHQSGRGPNSSKSAAQAKNNVAGMNISKVACHAFWNETWDCKRKYKRHTSRWTEAWKPNANRNWKSCVASTRRTHTDELCSLMRKFPL